jgi:endonuclease G
MRSLRLDAGYDPEFLAVGCPLPHPSESESEGGSEGESAPATATADIRRLDYTHFTVLLDPERRLAALTAVNIDGAELTDLGRGDDWHLDDRVPAGEQAGPELYARNDLDRGHLVRRRDPVWGEQAEAADANYDSFSYANAAPQAAQFNQSKELWNGLEDHVLAYAQANDLRVSVFTGPVFGADDPVYRGVRIPLSFWKVAVWAEPAEQPALRAAGYLLDQSPQLDDIDLETARAEARATDAPPPLGPFRTFQLPIADVARITAIDFGALVAADVFVGAKASVPGADGGEGAGSGSGPAPRPEASGAAPIDRTGWRELTSPAQLRF